MAHRIWKDMSLDDTLSELERSKLAVWDYPVSDKYTKVLLFKTILGIGKIYKILCFLKIWQSMQEAGLPNTFEEALERVRASPSSSEGFAFLGNCQNCSPTAVHADYFIVGDATDIRYQTFTNCDLQMVGDEFSRKPYALAVPQGSPLKDQFNDA